MVSGTGWMCISCQSDTFPFTNLTNEEIFDVFNDKVPLLSKKAKCGGCSRKIKKNFPYSTCNTCSCTFHQKCTGMPKKDVPLPPNWDCPKCISKQLPFSSIDQNSLLMTIHGKSDSEIDSLNKGPSFSLKSLLDKLPGQNFSKDEFLNDTIKSKYYTVGDFLAAKFSAKKFSIIHLNISSLQRHIDDLRSLLAGLEMKFDIICISETRLYDEKPLVNIDIDGYNFIHTTTHTHAGGAGMYINSKLEFEKMDSISLCHPNICESVFAEIKHPTKKNVIIGTVYRHPSPPVSEFLDCFLSKTLQKITITKKNCILAGDFNVDLIKYGHNNHVNSFYDEVSSFSFRPLVLQPSRVTSKSFTLIDNIFTNDMSCFSSGGNITSSISDHFAQFCQLDIFDKIRTSTTKFSRDWRNFNKERFAYEIQNINWDVFYPLIPIQILP